MEIIEALTKITAKFLNSFFRQKFVLFNQLVKISTSAILKNNPKMVPGFVPVKEFQNVSVF